MKLKEVSEAKMEEFRKVVQEDFPGDAMLQEVHLARLILHEEMSGLTREERVAYLNARSGRESDAA